MTFGKQIATLRKKKGITQESLAQQLGITNQAVSKWESDLCCPDVALLPKLADCFGVTIDELFGRSAPSAQSKLPNDGTLRVVLFQGNHRLQDQEICKDVTIHWQGGVANLQSDFSVCCEDVNGYVQAGSTVNCGDVAGPVSAGGNVNCSDIDGPVKAGGNVNCGDIQGDLIAGGKVTCGDISGDVTKAQKPVNGDGGADIANMWKDLFPE